MDELFIGDPPDGSVGLRPRVVLPTVFPEAINAHVPETTQLPEVQNPIYPTVGMTKLLDLPTELLLLLPQYVHNIEDFTNLSSTCRELRSVCSSTSGRTILGLAAASSRVFFRPDPHFLIAATVRQVSDWALLNAENRETLRQAMQQGVYSLLDLCVEKAQLSMDDIRRLHATRFSLINPISDMIDRCAGSQWYATPNFWQGGVSNPATIFLEPTKSLFQFVIYGELFASSMRAFIEPRLDLPWFDHDFRMDYIKYCIPDHMCESYQGMTVLPIGPYADLTRETDWKNDLMPLRDQDQVGLDYLLACRTWTEAWQRVRLAIGPDFEEEWRQRMWESAVQVQGLEGLEMLRPGGPEKWRYRLEVMRSGIERLEHGDKPKEFEFSRWKRLVSESPNLALEVGVTMLGLYGMT
ncbi:MAG: hypothetical protein Q9218_001184 [Villophora microphyllina]